MTLRIKKAALVFVLGSITALSAQAINLVDALDGAKKHDAEWAAAKSKYNANRSVVDVSRATLRPQVQATSSIAYNTYKSDATQIRVDPNLGISDIDTECAEGGGVNLGCAIGRLVGITLTDSTDEKFITNEVQLTVTQALYNKPLWLEHQKSKILKSASRVELVAAEQDLMTRVAEAYFKVLRAQADVRLSVKQEQAIKRQVRIAKRRYNQGVGLENEVLDAQASYDISQGTLELARASLEQAQLEFASMTGLYAGTLNPLNEKLPIVMPQPADPNKWMEKTLAHNPKLLMAALNVQAKQREYFKEKSKHYPELNLVAGYKESETSGGQGFTPGSESMTIGVQLKVPLYQGGATTALTKRALYLHQEARSDFIAKQSQASTVTKNLHRVVVANVRRVEAWERAIKSSKRALEATRRSYDNGTRLVSDVIDAENTVLATQRDLAHGRFDYITNLIKLKQAIGALSMADFVALDAWLQADASSGS